MHLEIRVRCFLPPPRKLEKHGIDWRWGGQLDSVGAQLVGAPLNLPDQNIVERFPPRNAHTSILGYWLLLILEQKMKIAKAFQEFWPLLSIQGDPPSPGLKIPQRRSCLGCSPFSHGRNSLGQANAAGCTSPLHSDLL